MPLFTVLRRDRLAVADPLEPSRRLIFPADNRRIKKRVRKIGSKEPGTVRWLHDSLRPDDIVYDIGANIGIYSIFAAARLTSGRVFAFEPHAGNFAVLLRSIVLNGMAERITPVNIALDARSGTLDFAYRELLAGSTGSQLATSPMAAELARVVTELKLAGSVDELIEEGALPPADLVKMDVDGNELRILEGMHRLLASRRTRALQIEVDPSQNAAIKALMAAHGYAVASEHFTKTGQARIDRGEAPETYPHNIVFATG